MILVFLLSFIPGLLLLGLYTLARLTGEESNLKFKLFILALFMIAFWAGVHL